MNLSAPQRNAVERTGQDVCVVAGPGSGKTRVLIERFAWLVESQRFDPARILVITFTEKAATEIKQRLVRRFSGTPELREAVERAWVSTIDGFCARLLREHSIAAGLPPDFAVVEAAQSVRLLRESTEQALDALFSERTGDMRRLLEALDLSTQDDGRKPDLAAGLIDVYDTMRVSGIREVPPPRPIANVLPDALDLIRTIVSDPGLSGSAVPRLREWAAEFLANPEDVALLDSLQINLGGIAKNARPTVKRFRDEVLPRLRQQRVLAHHSGLPELLAEALTRLDRGYREAKRRQGLVDFADLEEESIELLESDATVRRETAGRFDQVLMDELQDTNRLQWRLVNLIRKQFFGVGDINQSIYGFRHADPSVFDGYRNALLAVGGDIDELDENYRSRQEILSTVSAALDGQNGIEPRVLTAKSDFPARTCSVERLVGRGEDNSTAEAELVARRILQIKHEDDRPFGDFAVLVRTLGSTAAFEQAFDRADIPFVVSGGRTFLEAREARDAMAILAALVNPLDDVALLTVLRSPLVGWRDEDIFHAGRDSWLTEFQRRFGEIRRLAGFIPPDRLIAAALDECGYTAALTERAQANLEKLLAWLRREHRQRPRPLAELLEDLEALRSLQAEGEAPPPEASDAVQIMTIHSAKGLEYGVVFVSALHRGTDRRSPVLTFSPDLGLGAKWRNPATGEGISDDTHQLLKAQRKVSEDAEENRLLYVAMTRAADRLILSYGESQRPSPWIKLVERAIAETLVEDETFAAPVRGQVEKTREIAMERPEVTGQHDSSASVTSVSLFEACPRRYYLARYLGLEPEPDGPGTGAISLGLEVHGALAGQPSSPEAAALAERFHASDLGIRAARATRIEHEFDFLLGIEDMILRGQIDLWFEEGGELILVDYKTDRDESSSTSYALQLRLYALALECYAGRLPDRAVLYYLRSNRPVEVSLQREDLDAARNAVRRLRQAQNEVKFTLREGEQCRKCSFVGGLCPARG